MKYIGGYFAVFTLPNYLELDGRMVVYNRPGRVVGMYPVHQSGEAGAVFLFRRAEPLVYDHRDRDEQKKLLREAFADFGWRRRVCSPSSTTPRTSTSIRSARSSLTPGHGAA